MLWSPSRAGRQHPTGPTSPPSVVPEMLHRQPSETGTSAGHGSSKKWRLRGLTKKPSMLLSGKEGKSRTVRSTESDSHDSLGIRNDSSSFLDTSDTNYRQLREIIQRMRSAPSNPKEVDSAYEVYSKYKERANSLCLAILQDEFRPARHASNAGETLPRRDSSIESPNLYDQRSSFSGRSLTEIVTGSGGRSTHVNDAWLNAVRDWRSCLEALAEAFKTNLAETYRKFEHDATPEMVDALFHSKRFRKEAVHRMRNASVTRVMSADPQFFPRYEIRFRNYERVKQELAEIRGLVQAGESGISPERKIDEFPVSSHGDAILEFANVHNEATSTDPVLRFRVSSHMLAETSPIFAHMFSGHAHNVYLHDDEDINHQLPPPATKYICRDGSEAKLYRMPQFETNHLQSLEILLHAAHMHNEKVPREVSFEQFVAIAECCERYRCTSPLELVVEHRWLPQWMHMGADDMPDGMVAISYAFGLRQLFTRMSKSAILNLADEQDLQNKPWTRKLKDKIWAVRCAKIDQVYACCTSTIQEYIRPPLRNPADDVQPITPSALRNNHYTTSAPIQPVMTPLSTTPRCPKGSHWCDAGNLGWMMLVYNEMNLLSQILRPNVLSHLPDEEQQPSRSLAQIVEALRRVPSPVSPIHRGGVCDPGPAFRAAINDIFNSVTGLTLHDISGKSHGWGLSKHREAEPQERVTWGLNRMAGNDRNHHSVATEMPENIRLKVLSYIDDLDDLHAAAMINRVWYNTYTTHELFLMRNILRAGRFRGATATLQPVLPKNISNAEEKVPKEVADELKETGRDDGADAMTLRSEEDDESDIDDCESIEGTPAPSITASLWRETLMRPERSRSTEQSLRSRATGSPYARIYDVPPRDPPPPCDYTHAGIPTLVDSSTTTPRQSSPPSSTTPSKPNSNTATVVYTEYIDEPPLTDEEARRILWPDNDDHEHMSPPTSPVPPEEGLREKFRFGDEAFAECFEDKSLAVPEDKHLLSEQERTGALLKRSGNGGK